MKKILIFSLSALCLSCYTVNRNCTDFKTGSFESTVTIEGVAYTSTFIRTTDLQIETFGGKTDSASVRWINECEMVFKTINPRSMAEKKDIHVKILETTDSTYTFEYSYVGETLKQQGVAVKLK